MKVGRGTKLAKQRIVINKVYFVDGARIPQKLFPGFYNFFGIIILIHLKYLLPLSKYPKSFNPLPPLTFLFIHL